MFGKLFKGIGAAGAGMAAAGKAATGMAGKVAPAESPMTPAAPGGFRGIGARMRERAANSTAAPKSPSLRRGFGRSLGSRR